jgi:hypothetical protein
MHPRGGAGKRASKSVIEDGCTLTKKNPFSNQAVCEFNSYDKGFSNHTICQAASAPRIQSSGGIVPRPLIQLTGGYIRWTIINRSTMFFPGNGCD